MVFVFVIAQMRFIKSTCHGVNVSTLLTRVNRDTEIYFVAISSSHLLNVIMISVARVGFFALVPSLTRADSWVTFSARTTGRAHSVSRPDARCYAQTTLC